MADYLGSYNASTTVRFMFTTHAASGATVAPNSAFEAADLIIYKDGSATQRTSASGVTMTSPFDSITGLHSVAIDLSDNTDSGFYAAGSEYAVVLSPDETVDSLAVVKVLAYFSIERAAAAITAIKTKTDFLPSATAGNAGGLFIAGTNASLTITGTMTVSGGIVVTQSSSNQPAFIATGNGTGQGLRVVGGSGAAGMDIAGTGAASGLTIAAGTGAGIGLSVVGGGTSGAGISVSTTSGDGVSITPTAGHGIVATGQGASKHGMQLTGGGSGTCDGLKAVAGTGGVAIRGPVDVVTLVNTLTTYTGNTPQTGDSFALIGAAGAGLTALATQASVNTIDDLLDTEVAAIKTVVDAILVDTGTTLDGKIDSILTDTGTTLDGKLDTIAGYIDTEVAAIVSSLSTLTGYVDTEVAAIKAVTDKLDTAVVLDGAVYQFTANALELAPTGGSAPTAAQIRAEMDSNSTQLAAIVADTNELQTDWANGGRLDLLIDSILAAISSTGVVLSAAQMNKIADHVRRRTQANVEASSDGDTLSLNSQYGAIQQMQKSNTTDTPGTLTVKHPGGSTLGTLTLSTDAAAEPVDGVS